MTVKRLILPARAERPAFKCLCCGAAFYKDQALDYERHVAGCDDSTLRLQSMRRMGPVFGGDLVDSEFENWVAREADKIMEGRKHI